jgi:hypothetical protein
MGAIFAVACRPNLPMKMDAAERGDARELAGGPSFAS